MKTIHSLAEIPKFRTEEEEHEFWSTHDFSDALMEQATWQPDDPLAPPNDGASNQRTGARRPAAGD